MTITVSTDGSALGNPNGPMGWAWADHEAHAGGRPGHEHGGDCDAGGATNGTNQIGELCAVLEALRAHPGSEPLVIETDSQYAINCSTKWVHGWKKNGWKNAQKKPVKNAALIKAIDAELSRRAGSVKFVWVKGHAGNAGNEKVDELARTYAGDCRSGVRDGYLPKEGWESLLASEYAKGTDVPADARMLMDGLISAKDYHLGRGEDSGDGGDAIGRGDGRVGRAGAEDFSAPLRSGRNDNKQAGSSGRNNGEPTDGSGRNNIIESVDGSPTVISSERATSPTVIPDKRTTSPTVNPDKRTTPSTVISSERCESRNLPDASTPSLSSTQSTEQSSFQSSAATAQAATQQPSPLPQQSRPSGLAVSGTLRFTPPPSSSPTYDGQPRMISGYIMVDGYVNGDGTITIDSAPFLVRQ